MKKIIILMMYCLLALSFQDIPAGASEVDILVDKLVKKGILTKQDADEILHEVKEAAKQERAEVVQETKEAIKSESPAMFADLPAWVKNMDLKGDFRVRYEYIGRDDYADRHRGRYRLRLGFVTPINDRVDVGFGFASGDANPRSTNQTMDNTFDHGDLRIDYAYARYTPYSWLSLIGGKFPNPLFTPSDLLFDTDIRPEGASAIFTYPLASNIEVFLNTGFWVLDERREDENDPTMYVIQPGAKIKMGENAYFKTAVAMYRFDNVKNTTLDYTSKTNTLKKFKDELKYDYDATVLSGELGFKTPFAAVPFTAIFGDFVKNNSLGNADTGYQFGVKFGNEKIKKRHDWQFLARYEKLERDAWPDALTDFDTYDGETNVEGYKLQLTYGLFNNINLCSAYFNTKKISGSSLDDERFQLDVNFKF